MEVKSKKMMVGERALQRGVWGRECEHDRQDRMRQSSDN